MTTTDSEQFRIGVLAPGSNFVPMLASDMLAALKFGLAEARLTTELIIESAGYNADSYLLVPKVQQMILAQRVSCIIAPLNVAMIEKLTPHCASQCVPLIALNLTEDPLVVTSQNPFVFVNSFHLWHSAWLSGYLAAQRFGPGGATAVALHEGGYGLAFAFQLGLEAAQGTLVKAVIRHQKSSQEDPTESLAALAAAEPDFIWAGYSGKEAISFLNAYKAVGLSHIPLIGLSPLATPQIRKVASEAVQGIYFVTNAAERSQALTQAVGKVPNPYSILAYEAAHLIAAAVHNESQDFTASLRQAAFEGPRGLIRFDNGEFPALKFALHQVTSGEDVREEFSAPALLHEQYQLACQKLPKQGWVNPYLCA